jgi:hypothetical protein
MRPTGDDTRDITMADETPTPTIDADQIVVPAPPTPDESVGSEGGTTLVGSPRHNEAEDDRPAREPEPDDPDG